MVELALPANFANAEPELEVYRVPDQHFAFNPGQADILELTGQALWRIRFASFFGNVSGTVGSVTLTFQALISGLVGSPWTNGGPIVASAPTNVLFTEAYHYAWNTDIADNYSNLTASFGRTSVVGLPLMYLPEDTRISLHVTRNNAWDGTLTILGGQIEMERFRLTGQALQAGPLADVFLLPQSF